MGLNLGLTAEQIRAARAMLRWEQTTLAERAGVSVETIKRLEGAKGRVAAQAVTLLSIQRACEYAGVEFINDIDQPGVRFAKDRTSAIAGTMTEEVASLFRTTLGSKLQDDPSLLSKKQLIKAVLDSIDSVRHTLRVTLPQRAEALLSWQPLPPISAPTAATKTGAEPAKGDVPPPLIAPIRLRK
jgi:transcriptional regulator with XRE-family HTH domain